MKSAGHSAHPLVDKPCVVFTCLDMKLPQSGESLFYSLLPKWSKLVVIRSACEVDSEPSSDSAKSITAAVKMLKASTICVVRHSSCRLVSSEGTSGWRTIGRELESVSGWGTLAADVELIGLLHDDGTGEYSLVGYQAPGLPLSTLQFDDAHTRDGRNFSVMEGERKHVI